MIHVDDNGGSLIDRVCCVNIAALYYMSTFQTSPIKIFLDYENQNKGLLSKPFEVKILKLATARQTRKRLVHSLLSTTLMQRKLSLFCDSWPLPSLFRHRWRKDCQLFFFQGSEIDWGVSTKSEPTKVWKAMKQREISLFSNIQLWPSLLCMNKEDLISYLLSK